MTAEVKSRDCDFALYYFILKELGINPNNITATQLLVGMSKGEYPHFESVNRTRQIIEKEFPELRGKSYTKRHRILEPEARKELNYISTPEGAPGTTP